MSLNLFLDFKIKMAFVAVFRRMWRWCED